jgi:thiamine-phosphate pyrophosphorylase
VPERFGLYLVLTDPVAGYEECAAAAVEAGVRYVQLRMKREGDAEVLAVARRLRALTAGTGTRLIVNDRVDAAREADADGVHLGQDDMPLAEARRLWPVAGKVFGLSTHSAEQGARARELGPDYVGIGPVFATTTKDRPDPVLGPALAGRIARESPLTTVVIGGIDAGNLAGVLRQGAVNFAVVGAVCARHDPLEAIRELQAVWRRHVGDV